MAWQIGVVKFTRCPRCKALVSRHRGEAEDPYHMCGGRLDWELNEEPPRETEKLEESQDR